MKFLKKNKGSIFSIIIKFIGLASILGTNIFAAIMLDPITQGAFFTFTSLVTIQGLIELGFSGILITYTSHEWANLSFSKNKTIVGDIISIERMQDLSKFAIKWYSFASLILFFILIIIGYFTFQKSTDHVDWIYPWVSLSATTSLNLLLSPLILILEGCNQFKKVYTFRLYQILLSNCFCLFFLFFNFNLWSLSLSSLISALFYMLYMYINYKKLIIQMFIISFRKKVSYFSWKKELLPLQFKISIGWIAGFLMNQFYVPVIFYFKGPILAGQAGLVLNLIAGMNILISSWIAPKVPKFGILAAKLKNEHAFLLASRLFKESIIIILILNLLILLSLIVINYFELKLLGKLLPITATIFFIFAAGINIITLPLTLHLRSNKTDPIFSISLLFTIINALSIIVICKYLSINYLGAWNLLSSVVMSAILYSIWKKSANE